MSEINKGDVVRLKSGGPNMVVDDVGEDSSGGGTRVWCEWFNEKNAPCKRDFGLTSVEKV